ncbi:SAM-dependent chlorinase/fluorinase [Desulfurococcaceae archaeon MEX13E-LK6-19]|nr:SAM-dependent chlorinase/fluorinase [Desulfurococcaceae archaeon MEX13E-LK6-19]
MTDFGQKDPYVGVMKGVILSINPNAKIVDLTHEIPSFDIKRAALTLYLAYKYFPRGSIFVCVVDPGVGTKRRSILIETTNYYFIGPDNGCLYPAANDDGIKAVYDVSESKYRLRIVSKTFHGRDIFAPIAAWLSKGVSPRQLGVELRKEDVVKIVFPSPSILDDRCIEASVLYVDGFGNVMTNISEKYVENLRYGETLLINTGNKEISCTYERSFGYVGEGEIVCYINSWGYLEIGVNKGSAAELLGVSGKNEVIKVCKSGK